MTRSATARRWLRILAIAFFVACAFAYAGPLVNAKVAAIATRLFGTGVFGPALLGILALLLLLFMHVLARTELAHVRHTLFFPPLPMAIFIGLVAARFLPPVDDGTLSRLPRLTNTEVLVSAVAYLLAWLAYVAGKFAFEEAGRRRKSIGEASIPPAKEDRLKVWLKQEEALDEREMDLFGYASIADRLVHRLRREESTIALQGEFGSGKSSVCRIAEREASRHAPNRVFVYASCWGFDDATGAQRAVLDAIIQEVGKHVDCLPIRELPEAYVDALGSHGNWAKTLIQLGRTKLSPLQQLQRLSPIMSAVGKKIVLVIEDVDRAGNGFDVSQIQALLMQFRQVQRLSFILAISPVQQVDFVKLCDHLETIPTMQRHQVLELIHQVREMLLRDHPPGILLDKLQPLVADDGDYRVFDLFMRYRWPWQLALCGLLNKPRLLKHALRRLCDAWPRLRGEVNFDDLLSVVALRVGAPTAFQFLADRFELFAPAMQKDDSHTATAKNPVQDKLVTEWKELCSSGQFDAESASSLLTELYPATASATGVSAVHRVAHQSMQSKRRGEVYARRLFTEYLNSDEVCDQVVLSLMQRAAASEVDALRELAEVITDSQSASNAFEDFASAMNFNEELRLLSEVYAVIRERHGPRADRDQCPGFFAPWRRLNDNRPNGFEDWLIGELTKCVPGHLRLLTNIYYYWLGTDRHSRVERERAREAILQAVRRFWETVSPQTVVAGFDPTFPYVLFHLVFTSDYEHPDTVPLGSVDDWVWSGPILINAAKESPSVMLSQILIALNADDSRGGPEIRFTLNNERLEKWFGEHAKELLTLVAKGFEPHPEMAESTKYLINMALERIRAEVSKRSLSQPPEQHE